MISLFYVAKIGAKIKYFVFGSLIVFKIWTNVQIMYIQY